ncbi:MAG: alkaline phosphatase family protein [Anaerolineales bacterium]|nr:MAG: alkaline phosphatase family protein [Anaerolineales bacterium]
MPDLVSQHIHNLREYRLPGLDLGGDFLYPAYHGHSILNVPASVCRLLNVPEMGAGSVDHEPLYKLGKNIQRVILVLIDALALHRFQRWMNDDTASIWNRLTQEGMLLPLTSITPSTTSAALTSLWTGQSALVHGTLGYEMWLKEYGVVANTILHAPITFKNDIGSLAKAGFTPEGFMPLPTLGPHLLAHEVQTYAFQHRSISHSGLSQMFLKGAHVRAFNTAADLWVNLRHLIETRRDERMYIYVYWSEVDHFGHLYGPDDERTAAEFAGFSDALERNFLQRLSPVLRKDTLLILLADHGQINTNPDPYYELVNHPDLLRRLHIQPTGENRLIYLFVRPGQTEAVREYVERTWPNQFAVLDPVYAVKAGLFGPGQAHPRSMDRLGEYILVPRGEAYLWWADKRNQLIGRHGGLHPEEMLVPFLAARL